MGNVGEEQGTAFFGNVAEAGEINGAWISGIAADNHFGHFRERDFFNLIIIQKTSFLAHWVIDEMKKFAGKIHRAAMSQMPTMRQVHRAGEKAFVDFSGPSAA